MATAKKKVPAANNTVENISFITANGGMMQCDLKTLIGMFNAQQEDIEALEKRQQADDRRYKDRGAVVLAQAAQIQELQKELEMSETKRMLLGKIGKAGRECNEGTIAELKKELKSMEEAMEYWQEEHDKKANEIDALNSRLRAYEADIKGIAGKCADLDKLNTRLVNDLHSTTLGGYEQRDKEIAALKEELAKARADLDKHRWMFRTLMAKKAIDIDTLVKEIAPYLL